ncbi:MAG: hypothetical protein R3A79_30075 [Nannocystaceae bacterium]
MSQAPARRRVALVAALVGALTTLLLVRGHQGVGYVRDEGIYFVASRSYGAWAARLVKEPGVAMTARERDRAFAVNHEHPALMKLAAGVSARLLAEPSATPPPGEALREPPADGVVHLLPEGAAMRLPAQVLAGLGAALLVVAGASLGGSLLAGLLAAGWFVLLPRVWFNAGLHCFDVPVAVAALAVALAYRAALVDRRWALALGPILGVAIAIKHNALFLPLLFGLHYAVCLLRAPGGARRQLRLWLPLGVVSVAVVAPLVAVALWPWLWSSPLARLQEYFAFHRLHAYYNTEFLGTNYNQPPLPESYPLVLTWATVPSVLLALALIGLGVALWRDLTLRTASASTAADDAAAPRRWSAPLRPEERHDGLLLALLAAFPLALIAAPSVPIFGGTKHWLTAYPFLALAAAIAWGALWRRAALPRRWRHAPAIALLLVLVPSAWSTIHSHPYGLSQYAPLAGGARGAAERGLMRGFWGHAVAPLRTTLGELDRPRLRLYLHDLHQLSREQYLREGRWPAGVEAASPRQADAGLLFYERHMLTYELELWNDLGTAAPRAIVELDDVPLTSLYVGD